MRCMSLPSTSSANRLDPVVFYNIVYSIMIDCSRNGVLRLESIYTLLCNMSLMGLNMLQLYTEDTYEVCGCI